MIKNIFAIAILALSFMACQSDKGSKDMSDFADDKEFKEAHETPGEADAKNTGKVVEFSTPDGKTAKAYALTPEKESKDYLFVIHEWWGLNDHIKEEAERFYNELDSVNVLAIDLYDGKVATDRDQAGEYMKSVTDERAEAIIKGALAYAGEDAEISTVGWCFGGGWSLKSSILAGEQAEACAMYYGMPVQEAAEIAPLKAPVIFILARQDEWITPQVAIDFKTLMTENNKTLQLYSYDADHAFANPSSPRYVEQAATGANNATMQFLKDNMFKAATEEAAN
jgi:carboxymethylenebutenolidase